MGTNFYIHEASVVAETGESVVEKLHIGKRSGGWVFCFQGEDTRTTAEWKTRLFNLPLTLQIFDEYGTRYTAEEMWNQITATQKPWGPDQIKPKDRRNLRRDERNEHNWMDAGFDFYDGEFF